MVNKMLSWSAYQTTATSFGIETFQDEPKKVIDMFFEVNDVSVSLPTGYGKSSIYQAAPVVDRSLLQENRLLYIYYVNVIWPRGFSASALILN